VHNNSLSKNEFLKAYVLWNGIMDGNSFRRGYRQKLNLMKAIMMKQKNISRFQTFLLVTIC